MDSVEMTTSAGSKELGFTAEEQHQYKHEGFVVRQGVFRVERLPEAQQNPILQFLGQAPERSRTGDPQVCLGV